MAVLIRILLRYAAAGLVAKGVLSPGVGDLISADPDISALSEILAGFAVAAAVEGWYAVAKRFGWPT